MKHAVMLVIRDAAGKFLFVKRQHGRPAGGYWCPVSGKLEPDEAEPDAAVREAREEVGLEVRPSAKLGSMPCSTGEFMLHWWLVELVSGTPRIVAHDEISELRWVALNELGAVSPSFPEDIAFLHEHFGGQR